jgi:hypothetical protein
MPAPAPARGYDEALAPLAGGAGVATSRTTLLLLLLRSKERDMYVFMS